MGSKYAAGAGHPGRDWLGAQAAHAKLWGLCCLDTFGTFLLEGAADDVAPLPLTVWHAAPSDLRPEVCVEWQYVSLVCGGAAPTAMKVGTYPARLSGQPTPPVVFSRCQP